MTLTQPNGASISIFASGDEFYNWLHDADDYTILRHPDNGYYVYAIQGPDGELVASPFIVGVSKPALLNIPKGLKRPAAKVKAETEAFIRDQIANYAVPAPKTGTLNNLIVFIRFSGESEFADATSTYTNMFNSSVAGQSSMRNYFYEASYNALTITSTIYPTPPGATVVSYQDAQPRGYYQPFNASTNPIGYTGGDNGPIRREREHTLLVNAVNAIASQVPAGLAIDGDGDGYVDNVCFIVSGSPTGWASLLWPHRWSLYTYSVYINSKRVYDYNFQLRDSLMSSGVGVLCHEMFHSLGAPDLYHYSYDGLNPVYQWDIMEYNLNPPQHMGAYMKYKYGTWIASIPSITSSGTYTLNPLGSSSTGNCYKIASPYSASEYFVVEFRKKTGTFESSLPGSGLLVYRINPAYNGNASGPPDEVYVYRPNGTTSANGSPSTANYGSDLGRTAINDGTNPSSFLTAGGAGGLNIGNVTASTGATISFDVTIGGGVVTPAVSTTPPSAFAPAAAVSGGNVTSDGGATVTARGVCWSASPNPTTANAKTVNGSGTGLFTSQLTGLAAGTTYHVRAYATNSSGTGYGSDIAFSTPAAAFGVPFSEAFGGSALPAFWSKQNSLNVADGWTVEASSFAGGSPNEMRSLYQEVDPGTTRLITPPINSLGYAGLTLSFKHLLDDWGAGATLKVQTSSDGLSWTDEGWSLATQSDAIVGPATVTTTLTHNVGVAATYVAFVITGNLYQYDAWYIDDVSIAAPPAGGFATVLPEAIWAPATGGGTWVTEAQITDLTGGSAVQVTFDYGSGNRRGPFLLWTGSGLNAGARFDNLLSQIDALDSGVFTYYGLVGTVEFETQDASHKIAVVARTVNGNYAKTLGAAAPSDANTASTARDLVIQNLTSNVTYRSTVGLFNPTTSSVNVDLTLLDNAGSAIGSTISRSLAAKDFQAFNPFALAGRDYPAYSNDNVILRIHPTSGSGTVMAFGASANNATNDPAAHVACQAGAGFWNSPAPYKILPEAIWAPTAGGGTWVTEIQITDMVGGTMVYAYFDYLSDRRGPFLIWTGGGANRSYKDANILNILQTADPSYTYNGKVGTLELATQDVGHTIQVSTRTRNGDYSKTFPGLSDDVETTADTARTLIIQGLASSALYRTGAGFFNPTTSPVTVEFRLLGTTGATLGSAFSKTLAGKSFQSFNPFVEAGVPYPAYANEYAVLSIRPTSGAGRIMGFGSTANNVTNDTAAHIAVRN